MITTLVALTALIFVAAITPGPNNLAVLNAAVERGIAGTASAITGVLIGSLALLVLALSGADALFAAQPRLREGVSFAGCGYLAWFGARLMAQSLARQPQAIHAAVPSRMGQLIGLQFANPKAWTMVLTAVAAARAVMSPTMAAVVLTFLFLAISSLCLAVWAWLGLRIVPRLQRQATRAWFDRAMGLLLLVSAITILAELTSWSMPQ